jgi:hypothetical protein
MTAVWVTIAALAVGTIVLKSIGPVTLGGRTPSERTLAVIALFAPALLAALIVYETLASGDGGIKLDERLVGVAAAGTTLALRAPMAVVVIAAAATTAGARAVL